jgi:hypothetical protein
VGMTEEKIDFLFMDMETKNNLHQNDCNSWKEGMGLAIFILNKIIKVLGP